MKRIFAAFVLLVFMAAVFAHEETATGMAAARAVAAKLGMGRENMEKIEKLKDDDAQKFARLDRAMMKELSGLKHEEMEAALSKVRFAGKVHKREIPEMKMAGAEKKHSQARERFMEKRRAVEEKKESFMSVKEKYRSCANRTDMECDSIRESALNHSKAIILNTADMLIDHLSQLKEKVSSNPGMNDTDSSKIVSGIDTAMAELESAKAKASAAVTKDGLKAAAKDVRDVWAKFEHRAIMHSYLIARANARDVIIRAEKLEKKLDKLLDHAGEKGANVSSLQAKLDSFSAKVESAKTSYRASETKYREAAEFRKFALPDGLSESELAAIKAKAADAKKYVQEAQASLKDAHAILIGIAKDLKQKVRDIRLTDRDLTDPESPLPGAVGEADTSAEEIETPLEVV